MLPDRYIDSNTSPIDNRQIPPYTCINQILYSTFISFTNEDAMPEARECARLLLETIPNLMRNLGGAMRQCKSGEEEHLNMGRFRMLGMLHAAPRTLSELAASHHVTPSTMSRTIDVLVRKAWVTREIDPTDRRQVILTLTDDGRAALDAMGLRAQDAVTGMLARLDDQERARLYAGLTVLRNLSSRDE
jgi:DNA-binding MarR family transcriptional regulator